jgi:hypothetical protein
MTDCMLKSSSIQGIASRDLGVLFILLDIYEHRAMDGSCLFFILKTFLHSNVVKMVLELLPLRGTSVAS